jgi:hypothetical protein
MLLGSTIGRDPFGRVSSILVSGVATRAILIFSGISPKMRRIALLEIGCRDKYNKDFTAQFRNIPLAKER